MHGLPFTHESHSVPIWAINGWDQNNSNMIQYLNIADQIQQ